MIDRRSLCGFCLGIAVGGSGRFASSAKTPGRLVGERLLDGLPLVGDHYGERLSAGGNVANLRVVCWPDAASFGSFRIALSEFCAIRPGICVWEKSSTGYRFDRDLLCIESARRRLAEARRYARETRLAGLKEVVRWGKIRDADLPKHGRDEFPQYGGEGYRKTLGLLAGFVLSLPRESLEGVLAGRLVELRVKSLPERSRSLLQSSMPRRRVGEDAVVELYPSAYAKPGVGFRFFRQSGGGPGSPGPWQLPEIARPVIFVSHDDSDFEREAGERHLRRRGPKDAASHEALRRRIRLQTGTGAYVESVLIELSQQARLPLLGEYDPCAHILFPPPDGRGLPDYRARFRKILTSIQLGREKELPVSDALDRVCRAFDLDWDFVNGWIFVRSPRTLPSLVGEGNLEPPIPPPGEGEAERRRTGRRR